MIKRLSFFTLKGLTDKLIIYKEIKHKNNILLPFRLLNIECAIALQSIIKNIFYWLKLN